MSRDRLAAMRVSRHHTHHQSAQAEGHLVLTRLSRAAKVPSTGKTNGRSLVSVRISIPLLLTVINNSPIRRRNRRILQPPLSMHLRLTAMARVGEGMLDRGINTLQVLTLEAETHILLPMPTPLLMLTITGRRMTCPGSIKRYVQCISGLPTNGQV